MLTKEEPRTRVPTQERVCDREKEETDIQGGTAGDQEAETKWSNGVELGNLGDLCGV